MARPAAWRGYTLVELLVVMAVLGILASMAMPLAEITVRREKERELKRALWEIRDAIDAYHRVRVAGGILGAADAPAYPPSLQALTEAHADARADHAGEMHRFLRRVPRDPFADPAVPAEQSWGLRSYASEAARPEPGAEVYDVYSRSTALGLDGTPVSQW